MWTALPLALLFCGFAHADDPYGGSLLAPSAPQGAEADPFAWDVVSGPVSPGGEVVVKVRLVVPPGYHVYRDQLEVSVADGQDLKVGKADIPPGLKKADPADGTDTRELYETDVLIHLPIRAPKTIEGTHRSLVLVTRHQGCKDGLCYAPVEATHTLFVPIRAEP